MTGIALHDGTGRLVCRMNWMQPGQGECAQM